MMESINNEVTTLIICLTCYNNNTKYGNVRYCCLLLVYNIY